MTPEEKRRMAFEEFEELLREGLPVQKALFTAAEDSDLKPEVFKAIAEKHLGDLNVYAGHVQLKSQNQAKHADLLRALDRYIDTYFLHDISDPAPELMSWLEVELGREMTADERKEASDRQMKGLGYALSRDLGRILRDKQV